MSRRPRVRVMCWDWAVAGLSLTLLGAAAWWVARPHTAATYRLRMTAGSDRGARHVLALALGARARDHGVLVAQRPTAGSEEALDRVEAGTLDLALVQGALDLGGRRNLRQVAALGVEPLHLLVKDELYADIARHLGALRGRVVSLGEGASGTHVLAGAVLRFLGLEPGPGGYTTSSLSYAQLLDEPDRDKLPDAVFTVSLPPSPVARHLVGRRRFRLVALPLADAFALGDVEGPPGSGIVRSEVTDAVIAAFTYGVDPPVPPEPTHTLGTRLLLVAHKDVSPEAIGPVLDAAFARPLAGLPALDSTSLTGSGGLEPHAGALAYLDRNKPLIAADVVDLLEKELSIAGVMTGGVFFLWQWARRRIRRRHDLGFGDYLRRVLDVERRAQALESSAEIDLAELLRLQDELGRLRSEALERFAAGELGGEELMSGFLAHAGDARAYLTRLILHVRDNLEEQAQAQGRPARALWDEAVAPRDTPLARPMTIDAEGELTLADRAG